MRDEGVGPAEFHVCSDGLAETARDAAVFDADDFHAGGALAAQEFFVERL